MDAPRFDAVTRLMASSRSRRGLTLTIAASALAGLTTADANANRTCKRAYEKCGKNDRCCGKLTCAGKRCCRRKRKFVFCSVLDLCEDQIHCCAGKGEARELCCPKGQVCGPYCCPANTACDITRFGPRCACTNDLACPALGNICVDGNCVCDPQAPRCAGQGVGFVSVRRP
jgi:hypothetical protein